MSITRQKEERMWALAEKFTGPHFNHVAFQVLRAALQLLWLR